MDNNINSPEYWDSRFRTGHWEQSSGRNQTTLLARSFVPFLPLSRDFSGTLLDYGCALGDAIPVYHEAFPCATLLGMDISVAAIETCRKRFGRLATFTNGDHTGVPPSDVIIASNVLEHLANHLEVAKALRSKCADLFVVVPYKEDLYRLAEHVNRYDEHSFDALGKVQSTVFPARGWSEYGFKLVGYIYLKNLLRPLAGKPLLRRKLQIMYHFRNSSA